MVERIAYSPHLCMSARSTIRSSLKFIGHDRLRLKTGLSCFGGKFILKSWLIKMSSRRQKKISFYSISITLFGFLGFSVPVLEMILPI